MTEKAETIPPGRRAMLAGSGALLAAFGLVADAGAAEGADAALIRDCDAYCNHARLINGLVNAGGEHVEYDGLIELEARICEAQATTLAGHAARARAILAFEGDDVDEFEEAMQGLGYGLLAALVRDLVEVES